MTRSLPNVRFKTCVVALSVALSAADAGLDSARERSSAAEIEIRWHGGKLSLPGEFLETLRRNLEQLAAGALYAVQSETLAESQDLTIIVRYDPPLTLKLPTRDSETISVRQLLLAVGSTANEGWPVLFASTAEETWFLAKYSGPLTLEIMCSPELKVYAPPSMQANCHLAPAQRSRRGGLPNRSYLDSSVN